MAAMLSPVSSLLSIVIFSEFLLRTSCQNLEKSRSVWVEQGLVRGKIYKMGERQLQIFRGIPYAEAPIGDLRFKRPVKKSRWHQELAAVEYAPPCLQFMDFHRNDRFSGSNMERESEDCLYLNVFSPYDSEEEATLFPVLVWIHGGSFLAGSGDTGIDMEVVARNIVFKGVVLVTINYRLGPLGFMNYNMDGKVEGNHGIWDMVMALEWIQANMKQLNGDPSKVTLMGESAGAAAVSLLALSPASQHLFHQAILMSGSSLAGWAVHSHGSPSWSIDNLSSYLRCERSISEEDADDIIGEEYTKEEIEAKHCNYQDVKMDCLITDLTTQEVLSCLRKELNFSSQLFRKALSIELGVSKMIVDGELLPSAPSDFISISASKPILIGVARSEWAHKKPQFYNLPRLSELTRSEAEEATFRVVESAFHPTSKEKLPNATLLLVANASFARYIDDPSNTFLPQRVVARLQKMEADIEFVAPCAREVKAYITQGMPTYVYSFDFMPTSPIYEEDKKVFSLFGKEPVHILRKDDNFEDSRMEPFHGLDHAFIFTRGYSSNLEIRPFTKRDEAMTKMLTRMWTNFVKTGDPSTPRLVWPSSRFNESRHLALDLPPRIMQGEIHWPNASFWNVEVDMISRYIPKDSETGLVDPGSELTNEERVELAAYRRAWWALWVLVATIVFVTWIAVVYYVWRCSRAPRSKPYDNIVVAPRAV